MAKKPNSPKRKTRSIPRKEFDARMQAILDAVIDGLITIDQHGIIEVYNQGAVRIFGYDASEVLGKNVSLLMPEPYRSQHDDYIIKYTEGSPSKVVGTTRNLTALRKDGSEFPIRLGVQKARWNGETRFTAVIHDLTEELAFERQLQQSQRLEVIGTLAGGIAHDFNNLLFAIEGYAMLIKKHLNPNSLVMENMDNLFLASKRGKDLVQQIQNISRQEQDDFHDSDIVPMVNEALKMLRVMLPSTIEFRQYFDRISYVVWGSPIQIHQIVMNLCTNAAHAMMQTGGVLNVRLETVSLVNSKAQQQGLTPGKYVRLLVQDTGGGIPEEVQKNIFKAFFTTKPQGKGSGMGLSIVHNIVRRHNGAINFDSQIEVGTTFEVLLPLSHSQYEEESSYQSAENAEDTHLLLVDDEEAILSLLSQYLIEEGFQVTSTSDSREALRLFEQNPHRFDLVVTDQTMPNLYGDQLAVQLLQLRPELPIVLATGFSQRVTKAQAKALGIKAYLMKPFSRDQLVSTVFSLLQR